MHDLCDNTLERSIPIPLYAVYPASSWMLLAQQMMQRLVENLFLAQTMATLVWSFSSQMMCTLSRADSFFRMHFGWISICLWLMLYGVSKSCCCALCSKVCNMRMMQGYSSEQQTNMITTFILAVFCWQNIWTADQLWMSGDCYIPLWLYPPPFKYLAIK